MSVAQYIQLHVLDPLRPLINDSDSDAYLPKLIQQHTKFDPQTTPYVGYEAGHWPIGDLPGSAGVQAAENLCVALQPFGEEYVPQQSRPGFLIDLTDVHIKNLSQGIVESLRASGPDDYVTIYGALSWAESVAHSIRGISVNGNFKITQYCSPTSEPNKNLAPNTGTGTFTLAMPNALASATMPITALAKDVLTLGVSQIKFEGETSSMHITVNIDNIPNKEIWATHAELALNDTSTLNAIIGEIESQLTRDKDQIGTAITGTIDNYLKSHHMYPFGKPHSIIF